MRRKGESRIRKPLSIIHYPLYIIIALYLLGYPVIYFFHDVFLFRNKPLPDSLRFSFPYAFEERNFVPEPGARLNALIFPTSVSPHRGVVLYFHGNADNLVRWGRYADRFLRSGYDVWMYDYRGFGKSKGPFDEATFYRDADFMYRQVRRQYPDHEIVLYGYSLGTGIAAKMAADHRPRLLLLEAPYFSIPDAARLHFPLYPYERLLPYRIPTGERIRQVRCPIHIFHGTDDEVIPYRSSLKLAEALNQPPGSLITTIPGGRHKNLADFAAYQQSLDRWLTR